MKFKDRLKALRECKDLTQSDLSDKLNVARSTIAMYELGERQADYKTLFLIAEFFDVSVAYLLGETDVENIHLISKEKIRTDNAIKFLIAQYHIPTDIFSKISGATQNEIDNWVLRSSVPSDEQYGAIANFFDLSIDELKNRVIPLYPSETAYRTILKLKEERFTPINHGEIVPSRNPLTYGAIAAEGGKENRPPKKKPKTT